MILDDLEKTILGRMNSPQPDSYVSSLFSKGKKEMLKELGEESVEVIVASSSGKREDVVTEMADLWFHCMVLMAEEGVSYADVFRELENRAGPNRR
jgi:phosphoribosyl-ATP pyrophosphohydrolase